MYFSLLNLFKHYNKLLTYFLHCKSLLWHMTILNMYVFLCIHICIYLFKNVTIYLISNSKTWLSISWQKPLCPSVCPSLCLTASHSSIKLYFCDSEWKKQKQNCVTMIMGKTFYGYTNHDNDDTVNSVSGGGDDFVVFYLTLCCIV